MIRAAVWVDAETELLCAYVLLPDREFIASASCFRILADAIEHQAGQAVPEFIAFELGFLHVGTLLRPVYYDALRSRLARAIAV